MKKLLLLFSVMLIAASCFADQPKKSVQKNTAQAWDRYVKIKFYTVVNGDNNYFKDPVTNKRQTWQKALLSNTPYLRKGRDTMMAMRYGRRIKVSNIKPTYNQ